MSAWAIEVIFFPGNNTMLGPYNNGFSRSCYDEVGNYKKVDSGPKLPNPNHYTISETAIIGHYLAIRIKYYGCTNYEGNKILVYSDLSLEDLKKQPIDPHFSENKKYKSPMARFEPTDQGWINALKFCSWMQSEHLELSY